LYCEAKGRYCDVYITKDKKYTVCNTLREIEEQLPEKLFKRVHDAFLINKKYLEEFDKINNICLLKKNENSEPIKIEVSRRKRKNILKGIFNR